MYGNEALTVTQWRGVSFNSTLCVENEIIAGQTCTGEDVLDSLKFEPVNQITAIRSIGNNDFYFYMLQSYFYRDIGCLFALMFGFRVLAYLALLRKTSR